MTSGTSYILSPNAPISDARTPASKQQLHVLTLTPFFPHLSNPVYGAYISEPMGRLAEFNMRSTVIGVSPLHHKRRRSLPSAPAEWLRYPAIPGNVGLTTGGWFLYRRLLPFVLRLHERHAVDLIHSHSALPCGHAAYLLAERMRIPFVVTVHGLDVFNACFQPGAASSKVRAKLSAEIYRRAGSVICISRAIQDILQAGMQNPVSSHVIYNSTDPQLFFPEDCAVANRAPFILIVGNLLRGKGHELVLKAIARVAARFPNLHCVMIGEGPDQGLFANLAQSLGIADRVSFRGRQDRQAVAKAMRECTVFALPSHFEGLGCAYLEAMASAKPVIACEGQGIAEIIQHAQNGWLIPVDGLSEMTDALRQILSSPELRARLGANARQTILSGFTLSDQARHLAALYREVIGRDVTRT